LYADWRKRLLRNFVDTTRVILSMSLREPAMLLHDPVRIASLTFATKKEAHRGHHAVHDRMRFVYAYISFPNYAWLALIACSRSYRMSSIASVPTDRRISPGVTPVAACSSSDNCWCVVLAG